MIFDLHKKNNLCQIFYVKYPQCIFHVHVCVCVTRYYLYYVRMCAYVYTYHLQTNLEYIKKKYIGPYTDTDTRTDIRKSEY